jgi:hypothetical protein
LELRAVGAEQGSDGGRRRRLGARRGAAAADERGDQAGALGKDDQRPVGGGRVVLDQVGRHVVDARLDEGPAIREGAVHERRHLVAEGGVGEGVVEALLVPDGEHPHGRGPGGNGERFSNPTVNDGTTLVARSD